MLRIAICDDENSICADLENMLYELGRLKSEKLSIEVFYSGESLCSYIVENPIFDIIFLDIEFTNMNGINVGKKIRNDMGNETTQIVYISAKANYAMELFKMRPLDFLIKPLDFEKVSEVFDIFLKLIQKGNNIFQYKTGNEINRVQIKDILYFESKNRKINIYTSSGMDTFYGKLNKVLKEIAQFDFINIHKSYIVNYAYVIKFEYAQVTMSNNVILPISQANRKDVRQMLFHLNNIRGTNDGTSL